MFLFGVWGKFFFAAIQFWVDHISDRFQTHQPIFQKTLSSRLTFLRTFFRMFFVFECRHRFPCLTIAKFGRFEPKWLALIGQKYALIGHFSFSPTCSNRTWAFCKSLIMNKNCLKNASHVNKCKNGNSILLWFFANILLLENYQIWLLEKNELISHRTLPFWRLHAP